MATKPAPKSAAKPAPVKSIVKSTAKDAPEAAKAEPKQGRAIILPNGERRADYIRRRFFDDEVSRGDITREINKMLEEAGLGEQKIAYQIVFAATKQKAKAAAASAEADEDDEDEEEEDDE